MHRRMALGAARRHAERSPSLARSALKQDTFYDLNFIAMKI